MDDLASFARLVSALEPWRSQLVLVGGWAHRLYRFHEFANVPAYQPLTTKDTDLAFSGKTPIQGDIKAALEKEGFKEHLQGESQPPITHYELSESDAGFYAEFLVPLLGSTHKHGKPDTTMAIAGITAQKLRYLEILLGDPWIIKIGPGNDIPLTHTVDLQIANPVSFVVQKLLIQGDRKRDKQVQDVLYIHDTLELFANSLNVLRESWKERIRPTLHENTTRKVIQACSSTFSGITDTIRDAARLGQNRNLSPERLQRLCQNALQEVIGY